MWTWRAAGPGVVEDAAVRDDPQTERGRLSVEDGHARDVCNRRADEGAGLGLVGGELALGLHGRGACGDGVRLLDDLVLSGPEAFDPPPLSWDENSIPEIARLKTSETNPRPRVIFT